MYIYVHVYIKGWITEEKEIYMARLHRMDLSDPIVRDKAQQVIIYTYIYIYIYVYIYIYLHSYRSK
jgi:hypothetical protein